MISGEASPVAIQLTPRRFTAAEYRQMIEVGVFGQDERLELIDGEIVVRRSLLTSVGGGARASTGRSVGANHLVRASSAGDALVGASSVFQRPAWICTVQRWMWFSLVNARR
jgi:hypothetical protein